MFENTLSRVAAANLQHKLEHDGDAVLQTLGETGQLDLLMAFDETPTLSPESG